MVTVIVNSGRFNHRPYNVTAKQLQLGLDKGIIKEAKLGGYEATVTERAYELIFDLKETR